MEEQNVPQLRFPEFEVQWIKKRIDKIAPLQRGFDLPTSEVIPGEYPVVYSNGIARTHNEYKAKSPGVVTGRSGTIGSITFVTEDYWPHNTSLWITDFLENEPKFVYYFYHTLNLERYGTGSGVPTLNRNDIHSLKKCVPEKKEQQKIASFLSAVDKKIEQLTRKKELLEEYKKGVMQKLVTQEVRFKKENGDTFPDWEKRKLSNVLTEHKLKSEGTEEVFSVSVHEGLINQIEHLGRSFAADSTDHYNRVQKHDIVYTKSPTGDFPYGIIKQSNVHENVIVSPLYGVFSPETPWLGKLLHVYFESPVNVHNYLHPIIQKGAKNTINITNTTFISKQLKLPVDKDEQKKIGLFFIELEKKINDVEIQLRKTQTFKKGLLQQMFV